MEIDDFVSRRNRHPQVPFANYFQILKVIVESYDSASILRFEKISIILRLNSRFDSGSNLNTTLMIFFQFKIRFDIRFNVF